MWEEVRRELRAFAERTTVKGIGRTLRATNRIVRCCWILFLLVCLGLLLYQLSTALMSYYKYVVIRNTAVDQTLTNFPDVTICNLFPISDRQVFDSVYGEYLQTLEAVQRFEASNDFRHNSRIWDFFKSLIGFNVNKGSWRIDPNGDPNRDGFVVNCAQNQWDVYEPVNCSITLEKSLPFQRCVRVKPTTADVALVRIVLFVDDFWKDVVDSYVGWNGMQMSTGIKVTVQASGMESNSKEFIYIAPGSDAKISVKQTNVTRLLDHPRSPCTRRKYADDIYLIPYNIPTCNSLCGQRQVSQDCHCISDMELFTQAQVESVNGTFCLNATAFAGGPDKALNSVVIDRFWDILTCYWNFNPNQKLCDCPEQCHEIAYDTSVSSSRWPSAIYQLAFYKKFLWNNPLYAEKFSVYEDLMSTRLNGSEALKRIRSMSLIEDNFIQLTIQMSERSVTQVSDMFAMSWDMMASNLGGSLNLWLGISVLTIAEVIELLYSMSRLLLNKQLSQYAENSNQQK